MAPALSSEGSVRVHQTEEVEEEALGRLGNRREPSLNPGAHFPTPSAGSGWQVRASLAVWGTEQQVQSQGPSQAGLPVLAFQQVNGDSSFCSPERQMPPLD